MSNEAMAFASAVIFMLLAFVAVMWMTYLNYRLQKREQHLREAEIYATDKS